MVKLATSIPGPRASQALGKELKPIAGPPGEKTSALEISGRDLGESLIPYLQASISARRSAMRAAKSGAAASSLSREARRRGLIRRSNPASSDITGQLCCLGKSRVSDSELNCHIQRAYYTQAARSMAAASRYRIRMLSV